MTSKIEKIQANKLAPAVVGDIIQRIEDQPIKNIDWIESVTTDKNNNWTIWIKSKASYYPQTILKYNQLYKSRLIKGKLYQIEDILTKSYNHNLYKSSL